MTEKIPNDQPCPHCGRYKNRGVCVDMILVRDEKILLCHRSYEPFAGSWVVPGGYVEWDERPEETVVRETQEEIAVRVTALKLIGVYGEPQRDPRHAITIAFAIEAEGEPYANSEIQEIGWFDLDRLPEQMGFDHRRIIEDYRRGQKQYSL